MWKRVLKNRLKVNNYTIYHILLFYKAIKLYLFKFKVLMLSWGQLAIAVEIFDFLQIWYTP